MSAHRWSSMQEWQAAIDEEQAAYERAIVTSGPRDDQTDWQARFLAAFRETAPRMYDDDQRHQVNERVIAARAWQRLPTAKITDPGVLERVAAVFRLANQPE